MKHTDTAYLCACIDITVTPQVVKSYNVYSEPATSLSRMRGEMYAEILRTKGEDFGDARDKAFEVAKVVYPEIWAQLDQSYEAHCARYQRWSPDSSELLAGVLRAVQRKELVWKGTHGDFLGIPVATAETTG